MAGITISDVEYLYQLRGRLDEETILPDPVEPEHGMLAGHVDPDNFGGEIRCDYLQGLGAIYIGIT